MLQPLTIRPSLTRPATPTGKFEYGAYAFLLAAIAVACNNCQSGVSDIYFNPPRLYGKPAAAGPRNRCDARDRTINVAR